MPSGRMRRVDEAMKEVLSDAIPHLQDPRIGFVTVTAVDTSPDLRNARVHVSVLGSDVEREETLEGLASAVGHLQRRVGSELRLKHTPSLVFAWDGSVDHGMKITELLAEHDDEETP